MPTTPEEEWISQLLAINKSSRQALSGLGIFMALFFLTLVSNVGQRHLTYARYERVAKVKDEVDSIARVLYGRSNTSAADNLKTVLEKNPNEESNLTQAQIRGQLSSVKDSIYALYASSSQKRDSYEDLDGRARSKLVNLLIWDQYVRSPQFRSLVNDAGYPKGWAQAPLNSQITIPRIAPDLPALSAESLKFFGYPGPASDVFRLKEAKDYSALAKEVEDSYKSFRSLGEANLTIPVVNFTVSLPMIGLAAILSLFGLILYLGLNIGKLNSIVLNIRRVKNFNVLKLASVVSDFPLIGSNQVLDRLVRSSPILISGLTCVGYHAFYLAHILQGATDPIMSWNIVTASVIVVLCETLLTYLLICEAQGIARLAGVDDRFFGINLKRCADCRACYEAAYQGRGTDEPPGRDISSDAFEKCNCMFSHALKLDKPRSSQTTGDGAELL